jgi:hypothetical protein
MKPASKTFETERDAKAWTKEAEDHLTTSVVEELEKHGPKEPGDKVVSANRAHFNRHWRAVRKEPSGVQTSDGQKPETEFDVDLLTSEVATIAHCTQAAPRQVLADNAQLGTKIGRILPVDVWRS